MKRSEMLKLLYQAVDKSITETTSANLVDVILTAAENAGMKPPASGYDIGYVLDNDDNEITYSVDRHGWSPEDEEN